MTVRDDIYVFNLLRDPELEDYLALENTEDNYTWMTATELFSTLSIAEIEKLYTALGGDNASIRKAAAWLRRGLRMEYAIGKVMYDER